MYNLLEYSNYSLISGSLWNYYRDEINVDENEIDDNDNNINNSKTKASKSFKYKTKMAASTPDNINRLNAVVVVFSLIFLIKYLLFGDILICNWLTVK